MTCVCWYAQTCYCWGCGIGGRRVILEKLRGNSLLLLLIPMPNRKTNAPTSKLTPRAPNFFNCCRRSSKAATRSVMRYIGTAVDPRLGGWGAWRRAQRWENAGRAQRRAFLGSFKPYLPPTQPHRLRSRSLSLPTHMSPPHGSFY